MTIPRRRQHPDGLNPDDRPTLWPQITRALALLLFRNYPAFEGRRCRRGRNDKRQPGIPASRASRVTKFSVTLEINVTLKALTERKHVAELWPDAEPCLLAAATYSEGFATAGPTSRIHLSTGRVGSQPGSAQRDEDFQIIVDPLAPRSAQKRRSAFPTPSRFVFRGTPPL